MTDKDKFFSVLFELICSLIAFLMMLAAYKLLYFCFNLGE